MTTYELRTLITDLYRNSPKLQELSQNGLITMRDLWDMQDEAIRLAERDNLLEVHK